MLKSRLCDYSDVCILVGGTITIAVLAAGGGNNGIHVVFKTFHPFTDCISETNNIQLDNAKDIDVVMLVYNLIEYSDNYSKTSGSLWQYNRDEPALNDNDVIINFPGYCASFKFNRFNRR